jgi:hypothetical protein
VWFDAHRCSVQAMGGQHQGVEVCSQACQYFLRTLLHVAGFTRVPHHCLANMRCGCDRVLLLKNWMTGSGQACCGRGHDRAWLHVLEQSRQGAFRGQLCVLLCVDTTRVSFGLSKPHYAPVHAVHAVLIP